MKKKEVCMIGKLQKHYMIPLLNYLQIEKSLNITAIIPDGKKSLLGKLEVPKTNTGIYRRNYKFVIDCLRKISVGDCDIVHIQYTHSTFGMNFLSLILFPFFLAFLKIFRIKSITTLHDLVPAKNLEEFSSYYFPSKTDFMKKIIGEGYLIHVKIISSLSDRVIVHKNRFRKRLIESYGLTPDKIRVIPNGIKEEKNAINKHKAKKNLNLGNRRTIFYLGEFFPYKGIEYLIESTKYLDEKNHTLIVGGDLPKTQYNNPKFINYKNSLLRKSKKLPENIEIKFPGYIEEEDFSLYFSAADICVFPFTVNIGSSGGIKLSIQHENPTLVPETFSSYPDNLRTKIKPKKIAKKILEILNNEQKKKKTKKIVKNLKRKRFWPKVAEKHLEIYREDF